MQKSRKRSKEDEQEGEEKKNPFQHRTRKQQIENEREEKWDKMRHNSLEWVVNLHVFEKLRRNTPFTSCLCFFSSPLYLSFLVCCSKAFHTFSSVFPFGHQSQSERCLCNKVFRSTYICVHRSKKVTQ